MDTQFQPTERSRIFQSLKYLAEPAHLVLASPGEVRDFLKMVDINPALARLAMARRVLLLQGPVGPFFDRLAKWIKDGGGEVDRVAFQAGDVSDCQALTPICYQGSLDDWADFFGNLVERRQTDCVVLFGQSRHYHRDAVRLAKAAGIPVVVLEEGYFRPGFATIELEGVNGYSTTLDLHDWKGAKSIEADVSPWHFQKMAWHAARHYAAMWGGRSSYPAYQHHKATNPYFYAAYWLRSWARKVVRRGQDYRRQNVLFSSGRPYFFVPLQHDGDAQITQHSPFAENTDFIIKVLRSFAEFAPPDALLVFRQHPHARGGPGHTKLIYSLAQELRVGARVLHLVEGDTPDLAEKSAGVVLINSTVGLQALERGAPLMALGESLYRRHPLTFAGELNDFWVEARAADRDATDEFLTRAKNLTQAPVSLYALRDEPLAWNFSRRQAV